MSIDQRNDEFYMTLTPTVKSALSSEEYEKLMSDFDTQLVKPIKVNPDKKWRATLMNAFIPIDLSLVKEAKYKSTGFSIYGVNTNMLQQFQCLKKNSISYQMEIILMNFLLYSMRMGKHLDMNCHHGKQRFHLRHC